MKERSHTFRIVKLCGKAVAVALAFGSSAVHGQTVVVNGGSQQVIGDPNASPAIEFRSNHVAYVQILDTTVTGDVITTAANQGKIIVGNNRIVTFNGQIGTSSNPLFSIEIYPNASTTFNQATHATNTYLSGGSATFNGSLTGDLAIWIGSTANFADGQNITGNISNKDGTLNLLGNNSVSGNVSEISGTTGAIINAGANGKTAMFNGSVTATTLNLSGNGSIVLNGGLTGNLDGHNLAGTIVLGDAQSISGTISNTSNATLRYAGDGSVAASSGTWNTIEAGADSKTVNFSVGNAASTVKLLGNGTINLNAGLTGNLDMNNKAGTVNLANDQNITGNVTSTGGTNGTLSFAGNSAVSGSVSGVNTISAGGVAGKTVSFSGPVTADHIRMADAGTIRFGQTVTTQDITFHTARPGTVILADGADLLGNSLGISGQGSTLTLEGSSTVNGNIGDGNMPLGQINAGANGKTATFTGDLFANTFFLTGTGTINLNRSLTGDLYYNNRAAMVILGDAGTITGNVYNTMMAMTPGNALNFLGTGTVTGDVTGIDNLRVGVGGANTAINGILTMAAGSHLDLGSGTLTVGTLTSSGAMNMQVAATGNGAAFTSSGKLVASAGSLSGNERLTVNMTGGVANGAKFKLIDFANGTNARTLADANVSSNSATLTFKAQSGDDAGAALNRTQGTSGEDLWVVASFRGGGGTGGGQANYTRAGSLSNDHPAAGAGNALSEIANTTGGTGDMQTVINTFNTYSAAQLNSEVQKLAPQANLAAITSAAQFANSNFQAIRGLLKNLRNISLASSGETGLAAGDDERRQGMWAKGFGALGKQDQRNSYDGYKSSMAGFALGADTAAFGDGGLRLGGAVSYGGTIVDQQDLRQGDKTTIKSVQATLYASKELGAAYVDGMLAYARHNYDAQRSTAMARTAKGEWQGDHWATRVDTGYRIPLGVSTLTPLASLEWSRLQQDGYTESGANSLSLRVGGNSTTRVTSGLGAMLQTVSRFGDTRIVPEARMVWYHDFKDAGTNITASYVGGGNAFLTPGQTLEKDALNIGLGVAIFPNKQARINVNYDYTGREGYRSHTAQITGRWEF